MQAFCNWPQCHLCLTVPSAVKQKSNLKKSKVKLEWKQCSWWLLTHIHPIPSSKWGQCHAWPPPKGTVTWGNKYIWSPPPPHSHIYMCVSTPVRPWSPTFCSTKRGWHSRTVWFPSLFTLSRVLYWHANTNTTSQPLGLMHVPSTDSLQLKIAFKSYSWIQGVPNKNIHMCEIATASPLLTPPTWPWKKNHIPFNN